MVANPERGEVGLKVRRGDEDKEYILKLSLNAAVAMQKKTGKTLAVLVAEMERLDMEVVREMLFMFLQKHHAKDITTVAQAGDLFDDAGGLGSFIEAFQQLIQANNPPATGGAAGNPPTAQTETTTGGSTSPLGATA